MSKRLSPERMAECWLCKAGHLHGNVAHEHALAHAQAEIASTDELQMVIRVQMRELAEAKADIARLTAELAQIADLAAHRPDPSDAAKLTPKGPSRGPGWSYCGQCWQPRDLGKAHDCPARKEKP